MILSQSSWLILLKFQLDMVYVVGEIIRPTTRVLADVAGRDKYAAMCFWFLDYTGDHEPSIAVVWLNLHPVKTTRNGVSKGRRCNHRHASFDAQVKMRDMIFSFFPSLSSWSLIPYLPEVFPFLLFYSWARVSRGLTSSRIGCPIGWPFWRPFSLGLPV